MLLSKGEIGKTPKIKRRNAMKTVRENLVKSVFKKLEQKSVGVWISKDVISEFRSQYFFMTSAEWDKLIEQIWIYGYQII